MITSHLRMRRDADRIIRPWVADPVRQVRRNVLSLARCFVPTHRNNDFRKLTTVVLFAVWFFLTLGLATPPSEEIYLAITILCFTVLGQQWELEKLRLFGVELGTGQRSEPSEEDPNE